MTEFDCWPQFDKEMLEAVSQVLATGKVSYWTGREGRLFEEEFAAFSHCRHAIAVSNGTLALELALYSLGIGAGDEVIVPSRTFIASASCVVARGAVPVVADVDLDSQTLTRQTIEAALTPRTKGVITVHLAGWPCDMDEILSLTRSRDIAVIEDCAQAHGATYKERPVGSMGDVGAFSFCQDKILTTGGEGGMLVTNRDDLWKRAWSYKDHGKKPESLNSHRASRGTFRWLHESFGSNYRLTEMQSALGRIMLRRLPDWHKKRRKNAEVLYNCCQRCAALYTPYPPSHINHAFYKFYTFVKHDRLKSNWNRDRIIEAIRAKQVPCFSGSCSEIYREQAFPEHWKPKEDLPCAKKLGNNSLMFLVHPTLSQSSVMKACNAIKQVMDEATRSSFDEAGPTGLQHSIAGCD